MNEVMLNLGMFQQVLKAQLPIPITSLVELSNDGQYNHLLLANGTLVCRFPRFSGNAGALLREANILGRIHGRVSLATPRVRYVSPDVTPPGEVFLAYDYLDGTPLWDDVVAGITDSDRRRALGRQLGRFLAELHAIDVTDVVGVWPTEDVPLNWATMFAEIRDKLFPHMRPDARETITAHFESYLNHCEYQQFIPRLRHGDFGSGNVLYDPATQSVCGVLDFGGAGLGDPAVDLAAASGFGGDIFAGVCENYPDADLHLARAHFYQGTFALQEALYGLRSGDRDAYHSGMGPYV